MEWKDELHPDDAEKFKGIIKLRNDKQQVVGSIVWFDDSGPFYAAAVMPTEPDVMHRIGPIDTLEHAKEACIRVAEGNKDISGCAAYARE